MKKDTCISAKDVRLIDIVERNFDNLSVSLK